MSILVSSIAPYSSSDLFVSSTIKKISSLDRRLNELVASKEIDLFSLEPPTNIDQVHIFHRNLFVLDLVVNEERERLDHIDMNFETSACVCYIVALTSLHLCAVSMFLEQKWTTFASFPLLGVTMLCLAWITKRHKKQKLDVIDSVFHKYQTMYFKLRVSIPLEDPCIICLDPLKAHQDLTGHLFDGRVPHIFHESCVKQMKKGSYDPRIVSFDCPCCRRTVIQAKAFLT